MSSIGKLCTNYEVMAIFEYARWPPTVILIFWEIDILTIGLADPHNPTIEPSISIYLVLKGQLWQFNFLMATVHHLGFQGCSDGGYIGIYTPKISPSKLFMG